MATKKQQQPWLPDKKYYEYSYHKFFNPEVEFDSWQPWDQWQYPDRDLTRFDHIIGQQLDHIRGKRVLDVACHLGYLTLFCLHNQASYVTGTNIRETELAIAREINSLAGYTNFEFLNSNIYNIDEFKNLCNLHDTVIVSGLLYHINNHYQILKTIADSTAQTLILESTLDNSIDLGGNSIINWVHENTDDPTNGFEDDQSITFVGVPNHKWIEKALVQVGFKIIYNKIYEYTRTSGTLSRRCVVVGQKV
jgi:2-polyprenyl-3-methyl-5-hydroxy-6-metoxy-1,4-benzoquinol methylase